MPSSVYTVSVTVEKLNEDCKPQNPSVKSCCFRKLGLVAVQEVKLNGGRAG